MNIKVKQRLWFFFFESAPEFANGFKWNINRSSWFGFISCAKTFRTRSRRLSVARSSFVRILAAGSQRDCRKWKEPQNRDDHSVAYPIKHNAPNANSIHVVNIYIYMYICTHLGLCQWYKDSPMNDGVL